MVRKYSDTHLWVSVEGTRATVGITSYGQKKMGEIVYVELPKESKRVAINEVVAVLESTKSAIDVETPLSGAILKVNNDLKAATDPINEFPEESGWLYEIEMEDPQELESLMDNPTYLLLIGNR